MGPADKSSAPSAALFVEGVLGREGTRRSIKVSTPSAWGKPGNVSAGFRAVQAAAPLQNATLVALKVSNALASLASSTIPPRLLRKANAADTRAGPGRVHASFAAEAPRLTSSRSTQLRNCRGGFRVFTGGGASPSHRSKNRAHLAFAFAAARSARLRDAVFSARAAKRDRAFACSPTHSWASSWSLLSAASNCLDNLASAKALSRRASAAPRFTRDRMSLDDDAAGLLLRRKRRAACTSRPYLRRTAW
mmetsp:Transcript_22596/g.63762  ORF Transcript_22596/g.63762 Transcript_22596/m.63762 type:complete len:249 (-) Transcript_22596:347-1093(-)